MSPRLRRTAEWLFLITEALAWFIAMRAFATVLERSAMTELAGRLDEIVAGGEVIDLAAAEEAARVAHDAAHSVIGGPPLWSVIATAFAAYYLARVITRARLGTLGALLGIAVSLLVLNVVFHVVLAGDLRVWDTSGLARFIDSPESPLRAPPDALRFIADPDVAEVRGRSFATLAIVTLAMWIRFLVAGRSIYRIERSLRSFIVTLPVVLAAGIAAAIEPVAIAVPAVAYFVLGVLALAVANAARGVDQEGDFARRAPWVVSVVVSLGALAGVAGLVAMLAVLNVQGLFALIGDGVIRAIGFVLVLVLTPVFWVVEHILRFIASSADLSFLERAARNASQRPLEGNREAGTRPEWLRDAARLVGFAITAYLGWRLARRLFRYRDVGDEQAYAEERGTSSGLGLGGLLRQILPSRPQREGADGRWLERHAVYRLYARVVGDATERQFAPRAGETPLEFAAVANRVLEAPPFVPIALEFDRARYGGHFPSAEALEPLTAALLAWEAGSPVTDEIRARPARGEEPPEIRTEPDVEAPDTPASPFPPPY